MNMLRTADGGFGLDFRFRRFGGNRKAEDFDACELIGSRRLESCFRSNDGDLASQPSQSFAQPTDVDFRPAEFLRKVPSDGLDDFHFGETASSESAIRSDAMPSP